jgi:hypothetical protein
MTPLTCYIDNGRGRLIISEHPDSAYIAVSVNGASTGMFLDSEEKIFEAIAALWAIRKRIQKRKG